MSEQKPSVGRIVHYVSYGTPGGEYKSECRAATITAVGVWVPIEATESPNKWGDQPMRRVLQRFDPNAVSLCVQNPTGLNFVEICEYGHGVGTTGEPDAPLRYPGGTWHWPERV